MTPKELAEKDAATKAKVELQKTYCTTHQVPYFCIDGVCPFCIHDIFHNISDNKVTHEHITKCSSCYRSLCE